MSKNLTNSVLLQEFAKKWQGKSYCLWGAGVEGGQALRYLPQDVDIRAVIDSDLTKQGGVWNDLPVISWVEAKKSFPNEKILLAGGFYSQVASMLKEEGLVADVDFCDWKKLLGVDYWIRTHKVHSYRLDVSITQRCTLACEKCNMQRAAYKNPVDRELSGLLEDLEAYFSYVNFLCEMNILGGEPFMYKNLAQLLSALGENWRDQIGEVHIFTNGMVLPSAEVLDIVQKYGYIMDISDYYTALPNIAPGVQRFEYAVKSRGIPYRLKRTDAWVDFGYPDVQHPGGYALDALFEDCHMPWRGLKDKKVYFCNMEINAEELGQFVGCDNDWADISACDDAHKQAFLELDLGWPKLGHISYCSRCYGFGSSNTRCVPAAKQVDR